MNGAAITVNPVKGLFELLQYAWDWVRNTDTNGYLEMPGGRTATSANTRWYYANTPSDACPTGRGDEAAILAVWARNTARRGRNEVELLNR